MSHYVSYSAGPADIDPSESAINQLSTESSTADNGSYASSYSYSSYSTIADLPSADSASSSSSSDSYISSYNSVSVADLDRQAAEIARDSVQEFSQLPAVLSVPHTDSRLGASSASPDAFHSLLSADYDWQRRFEQILSLPASSIADKLEKARRLRELNQQFLSIAQQVGMKIIQEIGLPEDKKTLKSLSGKGIAGGEKYSAAQLFIKLTRDSAGIYGGDYGASKAAKHEIRSLQCLIECNIPSLFFPMMCIIDYLGYRIVCTSLIDGVGSDSLVYGSQNAGKSIFCSDPRMNAKIKAACDKLKIKGHYGIDAEKKAQFLYGPVDLEGHVVKHPETGAEKFYLLDFARLFPPESVQALPEGNQTTGFLIHTDLAQHVQPFNTQQSALKYCQESLQEEIFVYSDASIPPVLVNAANRQQFIKLMLEEGAAIAEVRKANQTRLEEFEKKRSRGEDCPAPELQVEPAPSGHLRTLPLQLKWLPRSEGLVCFNAGSLGDFNPRASAIADSVIHGLAIVCQNTGGIFFRLQRPELLARSVFPVSSDCFSGFGCCLQCRNSACPHAGALHHQDATSLTRALVSSHSNLITALAEKLNNRLISPSDSSAVVKEMHKCGINVRHAGRLRADVKLSYLREMLLVEMITRTIRHILTALLRSAGKTSFPLPTSAAVSPVTSNTSAHSSESGGPPRLQRQSSVKSSYQPCNVGYFTQYESGMLYHVPVSDNESSIPESLETNPLAFSLADTDEIKDHLERLKGETRTPARLLHSLSHAHVAIRLLNLVFGSSAASDRFWKGIRSDDEAPPSNEVIDILAFLQRSLCQGAGGELRGALLRKFAAALNEKESRAGYDLRSGLLKFPLLIRLMELTGLKLRSTVIHQLFQSPERFECSAPFQLEDIESFSPKARGINQDDSINDLLYEMAIGQNGGDSASEADSSSAADSTVRSRYHTAAASVLGESHPLVIASNFKLTMDLTSRGQYGEAIEAARRGIRLSEEAFGQFSIHYALALVTAGEAMMEKIQRLNSSAASESIVAEAVEYFSSALLCTERLFTVHPLIARLSGYLGRLHLLQGNTALGVDYLTRSRSIYSEFYGEDVANYLGPIVTMGKSNEIAQSIGSLALSIKPLVADMLKKREVSKAIVQEFERETTNANVTLRQTVESALKSGQHVQPALVYKQFEHLKAMISIMEEMNGVTRGFFLGKSLEIDEKKLVEEQQEEDGEWHSAAMKEAEIEAADKITSVAHRLYTPQYIARELVRLMALVQEERTFKKLARKDETIFGFNAQSCRVGDISSFFVRSRRVPIVTITPPAHPHYPLAAPVTMQPLVTLTDEDPELYQVYFSTTTAGPNKVRLTYAPIDGDQSAAPVMMEFVIDAAAGTIAASQCEFFSPKQSWDELNMNEPVEFSVILYDQCKNLARIETSAVFGQSAQYLRDPQMGGREFAKVISITLQFDSFSTPASKEITLKGMDEENARIDFVWTPSRDGRCRFSAEIGNFTLHSGYCKIQAPQGQGFCRALLLNHQSVVAKFCMNCAKRLAKNCFLCQRSIFSSSSFARLCQGCGIRSLCVGCSQPVRIGMLHGQVPLCQTCSFTQRAQYCVGRR